MKSMCLSLLIFTACLISLGSCQSSQSEEGSTEVYVKPPIEEEKSIALLIDVHLAEAAMKNRQFVKDSLVLVDLDQLYTRVFDLHGVGEEELEELMEFYSNHPKQYEALYERIIARLDEVSKK